MVVPREIPVHGWNGLDVPQHYWEAAALSPDGSFVNAERLDTLGPEHAAAVRAVRSQYPTFMALGIDCDFPLMIGDGPTKIEIMLASGYRVYRKPDSGIWPVVSLAGDVPPLPRFILEVQCEGHLTSVSRFCQSYFEGSLAIRAVLLILFFPPRQNKTRACVAILLLRTGRNAVVVADAVSFGSAPLSKTTIAALPAIDPGFRMCQPPFRDLPRAPLFNDGRNRMPRCPWGLLDRAEVRVPYSALFYRIAQPHTPSTQAEVPIGNMRIRLWPIYAAFESAFH